MWWRKESAAVLAGISISALVERSARSTTVSTSAARAGHAAGVVRLDDVGFLARRQADDGRAEATVGDQALHLAIRGVEDVARVPAEHA